MRWWPLALMITTAEAAGALAGAAARASSWHTALAFGVPSAVLAGVSVFAWLQHRADRRMLIERIKARGSIEAHVCIHDSQHQARTPKLPEAR